MSKFALVVTASLVSSSCIVGQNPIAHSSAIPTTATSPAAASSVSKQTLPKTIMMCNLTTNGKMTIYNFNGNRVNSGTVGNIRLPSGSQRIFAPGSEPRFHYSVTSQVNRTATLTLYLTEDDGTPITQKVFLTFANDSKAEGIAKIQSYKNNKSVKNTQAKFFINSHEFYD